MHSNRIKSNTFKEHIFCCRIVAYDLEVYLEHTKATIWKCLIYISFYTNHVIIMIFVKIITKTKILRYLGTTKKLHLHMSQKCLFSTCEILFSAFQVRFIKPIILSRLIWYLLAPKHNRYVHKILINNFLKKDEYCSNIYEFNLQT